MALVLVANLVGVATVIGFQLAVSGGSGPTGQAAVLLTVAGYLVLALPVATLVGIRRQRLDQPLAVRRPGADPGRGGARAAHAGGHRAWSPG